MRYVGGSLKGAGFLVVTYLFAFGAATLVASPYQETFAGWAAYKGQTLLLKPGIAWVLKTKGENYVLNAPANVVMAAEMGVSLAVVGVMGLVAGLVWAAGVRALAFKGAGPPPRPLPERESGTDARRLTPDASSLPAVAVALALVSGLGGVVPGYAAFLIGTWGVRTGASRRQRMAARFGQVLGGLMVAVWAVGLAMTFRSSALA